MMDLTEVISFCNLLKTKQTDKHICLVFIVDNYSLDEIADVFKLIKENNYHCFLRETALGREIMVTDALNQTPVIE